MNRGNFVDILSLIAKYDLTRAKYNGPKNALYITLM